MKTIVITTTAVLFSAGMAASQDLADQLLTQFQADGYEYIEIQRGLSQIKVEGIRSGMETEIVYDAVTGAVLSTEVGRADSDDIGRTGFEIRTRARDFTDDDDNDHGRGDDDDDHDDDNDYDDDHDDDDDDDDDDDHDHDDDDESDDD